MIGAGAGAARVPVVVFPDLLAGDVAVALAALRSAAGREPS